MKMLIANLSVVATSVLLGMSSVSACTDFKVTAQDAVNLAEHVINNVDITRGVVREGSTGQVID